MGNPAMAATASADDAMQAYGTPGKGTAGTSP
jgi:hypothetical protein